MQSIQNEEDLERELSEPYPEDIDFARTLEGDILVLGAGGKMGPTLVRRMTQAMRAAGRRGSVIAVSRFQDGPERARIEASGARTIRADLLDDSALATLPDAPNIVYMAGMKFGASKNPGLTWAMNAYLPGRIAERFKTSHIAAFSTGNVYSFASVDTAGSKESDSLGPVGEYAQSCLGRERVFQHFSLANGTPICLLRLNYAVEARYGVLTDIAQKVMAGEIIRLETGYLNAIWQGDANSIAFRSLSLASSPARILNIAGPERLGVRTLAMEMGRRLGREPRFEGTESSTALLSDGGEAQRLFGPPRVPIDDVIALVARWIQHGGRTLGKPTKLEVRDGKF